MLVYKDMVPIYHPIESFEFFLKRNREKGYEVYLSHDLQNFIVDDCHDDHSSIDYWIGYANLLTAEGLKKISDSLYNLGVQERLDDLENDILGAIAEGMDNGE